MFSDDAIMAQLYGEKPSGVAAPIATVQVQVVVIARRLRRGFLVLTPEPCLERYPHSNEIAALRSQ